MILLNISGWSLFFYSCLLLRFFLRFFIILLLRVAFIFFDVFMMYLSRNVSFLINHYINAFNNSAKSFIVALVCFAMWRVTKKNAFICSRFKFAKLLISILDIAFGPKYFEVLYRRSPTILELMRSLSAVHPDICFVENNNRSMCSFTPESCGSP